MKKFIYSAMAVAMLATTSCKDDFAESFVGEEATVEFSISTPEIATRAYSDGSTATVLQYAIYDGEGKELTALTVDADDNKTLNNGCAKISLQLKNNKDYQIVVWAAAQDAPYSVDLSNKKMTVDYDADKTTCNDETRDAFYAYQEFTVDKNTTIDIKLKRPFAQLNIGAGDFTQSANSGYTPTMSYVKVPAYSTLNFADGSVDGQDVREFKLHDIPVESEDFPYDSDKTDAVKPYRYLAMNYILVGADQELVDIEFGHSNGNEGDTRTIGSVPVQRNYRTNIYGNILTSATDINVQIVPDYTGENNVEAPEYVNVATAQDLIDAVNGTDAPDNLVVTLTGNINLNDLIGPNQAPTRSVSDAKTLEIKKGTNRIIDLNGYTLSATTAKTGDCDMMLVKGDLTVKNGTIEYNHEGENMGWNYMSTIFDVTADGVLNLNGVTAKNLGGTDMAFVAHLNNWGEVTLNVENSTLESNYVAVRVFNSGPNKNNVTIKNSTLKGGNYAFWVHNYTAADFGNKLYSGSNQAYDKAGVDARLNFNIFNGTNTFVGKNDTPIRYGFTDAIYLKASGLRYENNTYYILSASELIKLSEIGLKKGEKVLLCADIDLTGKEFNGLDTFHPENGNEFDGQGYTVSNWTNKSGASDMGFIRNWVGTIKNIKFENCHLKTSGRSAIVAAKVYGNIENCHVVDCTIEDSYWACGLIAGLYNAGNISNCSATNSSVKSNGGTGGIVGVINETAGTRNLENCTVSNTTVNNTGAYGETYCGALICGLINISNSTVNFKNCTYENNTKSGKYVGDLYYAADEDITIVVE